MTDSSNENGNSNGKRPASSMNGASGSQPSSKIVKFSGCSRPPGKNADTSKKSVLSNLSPQDFLSQRQALPIYPTRERYAIIFFLLCIHIVCIIYMARLMREVEKNPTLIVIGETGSGKTTQIPQFILEHGVGGSGMIAITQVK